MRVSLSVALAGLVFLGPSEPESIVVTRVFPQPGQLAIFVADADGSHEHPLITTPDIDYDPT